LTPRRYLAYVPIHRRLPLTRPDGARVALWVNPNVEFFGLDASWSISATRRRMRTMPSGRFERDLA